MAGLTRAELQAVVARRMGDTGFDFWTKPQVNQALNMAAQYVHKLWLGTVNKEEAMNLTFINLVAGTNKYAIPTDVMYDITLQIDAEGSGNYSIMYGVAKVEEYFRYTLGLLQIPTGYTHVYTKYWESRVGYYTMYPTPTVSVTNGLASFHVLSPYIDPTDSATPDGYYYPLPASFENAVILGAMINLAMDTEDDTAAWEARFIKEMSANGVLVKSGVAQEFISLPDKNF